MLKELFELFLAEPDILPPPLRQDAEQAPEARRARLVCDYIAGMTDNYAIDLHRKVFSIEGIV